MGPFFILPSNIAFGSDTVKDQIEKLIKLQALDLEQEELRLDVENRKQKVSEDEEQLEELASVLNEQKTQLEETRTLFANKKNELAEIQKGHDNAKNKFQAVTNSRDYASAEREVENFSKMMKQVEEEIQQLSDAISANEALIAKHSENYQELQTEIENERKEVDEASGSIESRVAELSAKAAEIAKSVQPQILARYRFIRGRRAGVAVVSASTGTCSGCHMRLQPQAFIQLQRQNTLECCQNCQRILYFSQEEHDAAKEHQES